MKLRLHHSPETRSMRTHWLLGELGLPFEEVRHAFGRNLRDLEFLAISPAGRLPALEIDGVPMFETGAIAEFLCETVGGPLYRAPGDPERRDWLMMIHFAETLGQHLAILTQQHIVIYEDKDRSPLLMKLEARRLAKALEVLEARLDGQDWLLAGGFSAADIHVGYSVHVARHFVDLDIVPRVAGYYARLAERPAFKASLPGPDDLRLYAREFYPAPE